MSNWVRSLISNNPELAAKPVRKRDRHSIHFEEPGGRATAYISGGPVHFQQGDEWREIDTAWQPTTGAWQYEMTLNDGYQAYARSQLNAGDAIRYERQGEWVMFQPLALNWVNAVNSRQQITQPQSVQAVVDDDILRWTNGYGTGRHFEWQALETRLVKHLTIDGPEYLPAPASWLGTGEKWLELEFIIKNSTGVDLWLDGVQWTRGTTPVATAEKIEFRSLASGEVLWLLDYPYAEDASGERVTGEFQLRRQGSNYYITVRIPAAWVSAAQYPIKIDPTLEQEGDAADGYIYGYGSSYDDARSTSYSFTNTSTANVGQRMTTNYYVYRTYLKFDTSSLAWANVVQVNLDLYASGDSSATDFDVQIVKQDWGSQEPLSNAAKREAAYDNCLTSPADLSIWISSSDFATGRHVSGNLDTSWINKTGYTYYSLRSDRDYGNIAPTGNEYVTVNTADAAAANRPKLVIVYEEGEPPEVAGALSAVLADATSNGTGAVEVRGIINVQLDDMTASGQGKTEPPPSGDGSMSLHFLMRRGLAGRLWRR